MEQKDTILMIGKFYVKNFGLDANNNPVSVELTQDPYEAIKINVDEPVYVDMLASDLFVVKKILLVVE